MSLLQDRIKKYEIPGVMYQPVFDRVLVYQIPTVERETFQDSVLYKPESTKAREKAQSPRGVVMAVGQKAREILDDHGIEVGHIVWFARLALWKHEVDATSKQFSIIRAGEICGSEDLLSSIDEGAVKFQKVNGQWVISGHDGVRTDPQEWTDQ